ncbi:hypothetical protein [Oceanobacter mangrovi]|uniref:hypothetical protein n=1 Tax=Oceanobacter mangrovi TaxID=2862510 RepID=UPI001C8DB0B4|nr:hypothetical protein [Oceanobacter mangrovi]
MSTYDAFTISGYHVKSRQGMDHWSAILEEWILTIERYSRLCEGREAPFVFTEVANVGLLAAAVWRSGGIATQEYVATKGVKHRPKWTGRVDLWLYSNGKEQILEAKLNNLPVEHNQDVSGFVEEKLGIALEDARQSKSTMDVDSLGTLFIVPSITLNQVKRLDDSDEEYVYHQRLEEYIDAILDTNNYQAAAWCFPKEMRYTPDEEGFEEGIKGDGKVYPGVVLLLKKYR